MFLLVLLLLDAPLLLLGLLVVDVSLFLLLFATLIVLVPLVVLILLLILHLFLCRLVMNVILFFFPVFLVFLFVFSLFFFMVQFNLKQKRGLHFAVTIKFTYVDAGDFVPLVTQQKPPKHRKNYYIIGGFLFMHPMLCKLSLCLSCLS